MTLEQYIKDAIRFVRVVGHSTIDTKDVLEWIDLYNRHFRNLHTEKHTPHKCPICNGCGLVPGGFYESVLGGATVSGNTTEQCRSCNNGIIWK